MYILQIRLLHTAWMLFHFLCKLLCESLIEKQYVKFLNIVVVLLFLLMMVMWSSDMPSNLL